MNHFFGRRLRLTLIAQLYAQAVMIGMQLVTIPFLISAWGLSLYGTWLLVSALPTYLIYSELGLTYAAKNEMTVAVARQDSAHALGIYQSVFCTLVIITATIFCIFTLLANLVDIQALFSIDAALASEATSASCLLVASALLYQFLLLDGAAVRAIGRPATEAFIAGTVRLGEGMCLIITSLVGGKLLAAAFAILAFRITYNVIVHIWLCDQERWLRYGAKHASLSELKRLLKPSAGMLASTLTAVMFVQGPLLIIGAIATPERVATFNVLRTFARIATLAANTLTNSTVAEYATLYGRGDNKGLRGLLSAHSKLLALGMVAYMIVTTTLAQPIVSMWTGNTISIEQPLFLILTISVCAEMVWTTILSVLGATNRHFKISMLSLLIAIAMHPIAYIATQTYEITGTALVVLAANATIAAVSLTHLGRFYIATRVPSEVKQ